MMMHSCIYDDGQHKQHADLYMWIDANWLERTPCNDFSEIYSMMRNKIYEKQEARTKN